MTVNPLPPQAYTKETLQKAYAWLLTQTPSLKEMASTQEMLISLYLKAQRSGDASLETPSIQNFKQELKSLASMMGELQPPRTASNSAQMQSHAPQARTTSAQTYQTSQQLQSTQPSMSERPGMPQNFTPSSSSSGYSLDEQSLHAIQDVKQALNLSTDSEALRALISLGYRQFKKL